MVEPVIIDNVDITTLDEGEFMLLGLSLMQASIRKLAYPNAKEHADWFSYHDELNRRYPKEKTKDDEIQ